MLTIFNVIIYYYIYIHNVWIFFYLLNFYQSLISSLVFCLVFFVSSYSWNLFSFNFHRPSASMDPMGSILLTYRNVSVLSLTATGVVYFSFNKKVFFHVSSVLAYYCLLLLFLAVVLSRYLALVASLPLLLPALIQWTDLRFASWGNGFMFWHPYCCHICCFIVQIYFIFMVFFKFLV